MLRAQVILAETLVEILRARFRKLRPLRVDGVLNAAMSASDKEEQCCKKRSDEEGLSYGFHAVLEFIIRCKCNIFHESEQVPLAAFSRKRHSIASQLLTRPENTPKRQTHSHIIMHSALRGRLAVNAET